MIAGPTATLSCRHTPRGRKRSRNASTALAALSIRNSEVRKNDGAARRRDAFHAAVTSTSR